MSTSPTTPAPSSTQSFADDDPYLIIAADSHAGLPTEQYREYLESKYYPQFDEFLAERDATGRGCHPPGCAQRRLRQEVVRGPRRGARRRLGRHQARPGPRRRRRRPPRSSTPTPTPSRAAPACPSAPGWASRATSIPSWAWRGQGPQPVAGRAVLAQPGTPQGRGARAHHRRDRQGAGRDPLGQGARPRCGDDPGHVGQPEPRTTTRSTTRCGRSARSSRCRSSPTPVRRRVTSTATTSASTSPRSPGGRLARCGSCCGRGSSTASRACASA